MRSINLIAALALTGIAGMQAQTKVEWEVLGHTLSEDGKPSYTQRFIVTGDMNELHRLAFNQFDREMQPLNTTDTVVRVIPGYYYVASPRFQSGADTIIVDILTSGYATQYSFGADGVHGVNSAGQPFDVNFARRSQTANQRQWAIPGRDRMPYGPEIYEINERITANAPQVGPYDLIPSFKSVKLGKGECSNLKIINETIDKHLISRNPEFYSINVGEKGISITGATDTALKTARRVAERLIKDNPNGLPTAIIEDWPDFGYRGMMIDVARNFQTLDQMKKFVDAMADMRFNRLQFHFIDDEAWRLEIPGLPELTEYGARRGYTTDESDFLAQIYCGNGNPESDTNHGYYTREEFIDFLRYCADRGIDVIPEIETPGHARAAVWAMENRYRRTGDDSMRLREDGDTSVYRSAQDFGDNVMNPALPGSYKFVDKVLDEVIAMYDEAGVPLTTIHLGGDEVPHGAWSGSPSAIRFMKEHGMESESELHAYWVGEMAKAVAKRGKKLAGWQEIGLGHSADFADTVTPDVAFVNLWIGNPGKDGVRPGTKALDLGYPVVVSAVNHFYLDLAYSHHPGERGLIWGGVIDEFKSLDGYPYAIAPASPDAKSSIVGVQGQMWAETMRGPQWMESYLFPRIYGVAERAWNADSTYNHPTFNAILSMRELPSLNRRNINFHLRQPGAKVDNNGKVVMNSPYSNAEIRYTLDGTDPVATSPLYTGPVTIPAGTTQVRATLFWLGRKSVPTILNL